MTDQTLSKIPVKAYRKCDLRVLLFNPGINIRDPKAVAEAQPMNEKKFQKLLSEKLSGKVPEEDWQTAKILPEECVRLILSPDEKKNKYSRS